MSKHESLTNAEIATEIAGGDNWEAAAEQERQAFLDHAPPQAHRLFKAVKQYNAGLLTEEDLWDEAFEAVTSLVRSSEEEIRRREKEQREALRAAKQEEDLARLREQLTHERLDPSDEDEEQIADAVSTALAAQQEKQESNKALVALRDALLQTPNES